MYLQLFILYDMHRAFNFLPSIAYHDKIIVCSANFCLFYKLLIQVVVCMHSELSIRMYTGLVFMYQLRTCNVRPVLMEIVSVLLVACPLE